MTRVVRHLIVVPAFCLLVTVAVVLTPLLVVVTGLWSLVADRRQLRPLRGALFILSYAVHDVAAVLAGLGLWLRLGGRGAMGGEAMQARHYRLIGWLFSRLARAAARILGVRAQVEDSPEAERALTEHRRPLLVLSRHAGPGDSFLLVDQLLRRGRRPRIVLRSILQLDPCIDLLGNRLPFCFVPRSPGSGEQTRRRIATISADMDGRGAVLLFPEGGNVTPDRRRHAIRTLLRRGRRRHARLAAGMEHVIAPRPAGTLAALAAAPGADVVFVAHTGLAGMHQRLWRRIPVDVTMHVRAWVVPAESIPADADARVDWLFGWWATLDAWIATAMLAPAGRESSAA